MERKGVYVSVQELERIIKEASADRDKYEAKLNGFLGIYYGPELLDLSRPLPKLPKNKKGVVKTKIKWGYHGDVAWFLYEHLGLDKVPASVLPPKLKEKDSVTGKEALEYLHIHNPKFRQELDTLRGYRRACKSLDYASKLLRNSFATEWDGIRVVHPTYGTGSDGGSSGRDKSGTATGRLSISGAAPLHQISRDKTKDPYRVRRAFVAPPRSRLLIVDLSQLEVRIQAHLHVVLFRDHRLAKLCSEADFHAVIAQYAFSKMWPTWHSEVTGECITQIAPQDFKKHKDPLVPWMRDKEKELFYGLGYGKSDSSFGSTMWDLNGDPLGVDFARSFREALYSKIPALAKYTEWVRERVATYGGMHSLLGRWRPLTRDNRGHRQGLNQVPQGGGAEIVMLWMLLCDMYGFDLRLQVHDEIHILLPETQRTDLGSEVQIVVELAKLAGEMCGLTRDTCEIDAEGKICDSWDDK